MYSAVPASTPAGGSGAFTTLASAASLLRRFAVQPGLPLETLDSVLERRALRRTAEERIAVPPVDAHLAGLVRRSHQQAQPDREQLDVEQVDLNVARDHDALVEDALEHLGQLR